MNEFFTFKVSLIK